MLSWRQALLLGAGLLLAAAAVRKGPGRVRWMAAYFAESALLAGAYAAWQLLLDAVVSGTAGAVGRGRWLWHAEHDLRIPSEGWFQRPFLHHPTLGRAADVYYGGAHFTVMGLFLAWLFVRHRERYAPLRLQLLLVTGAAALIQSIPVAPPRLVPGIGVVDLPRLLGQSVYDPNGLSDPGQLIAMPSVHVAWAGLVAYGVMTAAPSQGWSRIGRWTGPLHLVLTVAVVVGTGNHYWADGVAALVLLAGAGAVAASATRWVPWPRGAKPTPARPPLLHHPLLVRSRTPSTHPTGADPRPGPGSSPPGRGSPTPGRRT